MAGRGPAPKPNAVGRGRGVQVRHTVTERPEGPRPLPEGEWGSRARRWWERMSAGAASTLWLDEDWDLLERGLPLVDAYWAHISAGETRDAVVALNAVLKLETQLWLSPTERARNGVKVEIPDDDPQVRVSGSRARLRAAG